MGCSWTVKLNLRSRFKEKLCTFAELSGQISICRFGSVVFSALVKVARYSFSGSIAPKIEHRLRHHKQRFWTIATSVALNKGENLWWSEFQWHRSCHSSEMTPLPILLASVFLGFGNCFCKLFFQNRSRELFLPIAASMFVTFKRNL